VINVFGVEPWRVFPFRRAPPDAAEEEGSELRAVLKTPSASLQQAVEGLETAPRTGRPREIDDADAQRVLAMTLVK
jgi:hypothetical protein